MKMFAYKKFFKILIAIFSVALMVFVLKACGSSTDLTSDAETLSIPMNLSHVTLPEGVDLNSIDVSKLNLADQLDLATVATSVQITVAGCKTGNTYSTTVSGYIKLYTGDQSCLVKLTSFTAFGETFTPTGGTNFTTWLVNDKGTFKSTTTANTLYVLITSQVTQAGILGTDQVTYLFTDIQATTTSSLTQSSTSYSIPFSVSIPGAPASSIVVSVTGCSSGYTVTNKTITSGLVVLLRGDQNCLVKLISFVSSSTVYSISTNFTTWLDGNTGVFANGAGPNLTLVVVSQVTQSGVVSTDTVAYSRLVSVSGCGTTFDGGSGTSTSPYLVNTATTLSHVPLCTTSSTYFAQISTINLSGVTWTPGILYGQYEGNNFNISNLSYTDTTTGTTVYDGLFTQINSGATINDVNVVSGTVSSKGNMVGLLAGYNLGTITNCTTSGTVTLTNSTTSTTNFGGGLVGVNGGSGSISYSSSSANVIGNEVSTVSSQISLGGLVGSNNDPTSTISYSFATGNVSMSTMTVISNLLWLGNFAGAVNGSVTNSYATGNVTVPSGGTQTNMRVGCIGDYNGTNGTLSGMFAKGTFSIAGGSTAVNVGGMVGYINVNTVIMQNNYTMAALSVSGVSGGNIGGHVGFTSGTNPGIADSYAANASFSSNITAHGFIGSTGRTITSSYYYTNGGTMPSDTSTGVTGLATQSAMQTQSNFTGFTFDSSNWVMPTANTFSNPSGFLSPVLFWQCGTNGISC